MSSNTLWDSVDQAHILLVEFCKQFESLYRPEHCTPNMHMSLHLKECLLDCSPFPTLWCFAFERFNGVLEGIGKSWVLPEKQMFIKFVEVQRLLSISKNIGETNNVLSFFVTTSKLKEILSLDRLAYINLMTVLNFNFFVILPVVSTKLWLRKRYIKNLFYPIRKNILITWSYYISRVCITCYIHQKSVEVLRFHKEYKGIVINM